MKDIINSLEIKNLIGKGNFGSVYKIEKNGEREAVKVVDIYPQNSEFSEILGKGNEEELETKTAEVMKEIEMLYHLKGNTHIVNYLDHYVSKKDDVYSLYLRMEYLHKLDEYYGEEIESGKALSITYDILDALTICEENGIVHGDIKPQNIMVDKQGNNKLTDFGIAKIIGNQKVNNYTPAYAAPEIITNCNYTKQSDLYSLGLVIYQIYNNNLLPFMKKDFQKKDISQIIQERLSEDIKPSKNGTKELNEFLSKALNRNPEERFQSAKDMRNALSYLEQHNLLPKVLVALPVMLAIAIKFNTFNVLGAEIVDKSIRETAKQVVKEGTKKSIVNTLTTMTTTAKVIMGVVVTLIVGGGVLVGTNMNNNEIIASMFGNKNDVLEKYRDYDEKKIYEEVIEKMNKEIKYVKTDTNSDYPAYYRNEIYVIDNKICTVQRFKSEVEGSEEYNYSINTPETYHHISFAEDGIGTYGVTDIENEVNEPVLFYNFYETEYFEIKDIIKQEKDKHLSLTLHRIYRNEETVYSSIEYFINSEGYIDQIISKITDDTFKNAIDNRFVETFSNYNEKSDEDFDKQIKLMKSCSGLSEAEIVVKSGFKK